MTVCFSHLPPREQLPYLGIIRATREPRYLNGVPPIELLPYLRLPNTCERLESFLRNLTARCAVELDPADRANLRELAGRVENEHRRSAVQATARRILLALSENKPLRRRDVELLHSELESTLANLIEKRVADLRHALESCEGCKETVTRSPYRIMTTDGSQLFHVVSHLDELYVMVLRPAWLHRLGYGETPALWTVHQRFRRAVRTGERTNDHDAVVGRLMPLHEIPDACIRAQLQRALELSDWFEKVARCFYKVDPEDGSLYMRHEAREIAAEAVLFLTAVRNAILEILNDIFVPAGFDPLPLVAGCGRFPQHELWIPKGSFAANRPAKLPQAELQRRFDELHGIGLFLRYCERGGFVGPDDRPRGGGLPASA